MSPFVGVPSTELRDRWVPGGAVWERSLDGMRDRMAGATSASEILQILEDEMRSRLVPEPAVVVLAVTVTLRLGGGGHVHSAGHPRIRAQPGPLCTCRPS